MAKAFSQLPNALALTGTEILGMDQGLNTVQASLTQVAAFARPATGTTGGTFAAGNDPRFIGFTPEQYGAIGDGTSRPLSGLFGSLVAAQAVYPDALSLSDELDWAAFQKAIGNAQAVAGLVMAGAKTYVHNRALTISSGCSVEGVGSVILYGSLVSNVEAVNVPIQAPYLAGTVILMTAAATNAINITALGTSVHLRQFGIRFADTIRFSNTGHGVYWMPPVLDTIYRNGGSMASRWDTVNVFGHDGNHYAFWICNPLQGHFSHLSGFGGGGLCFEVNGEVDKNNLLGNCVVDASYFNTFIAGSGHAYWHKHTNGELILMQYNRPQSWVKNEVASGLTTSVPTSAQSLFKVDVSTGTESHGGSAWLTIINPDFETDIPGVTKSIPRVSGLFISPGLDNSSGLSQSAQTDNFTMGPMTSTGANVNVDGRSTASIVAALSPGSTTPSTITSGDLAAVRTVSTGLLFLGSDGLGFLFRNADAVYMGPALNLPPRTTPATPTSGVTLYVDTNGDLHSLHSSGTNRVISAH